MLTPLGKELAKYRIDKGVNLREMAVGVGVSATFLSMLGHGRKNAPNSLIQKIIGYFELDESQAADLLYAESISRQSIKIKLVGLSGLHRKVAHEFTRQLSTLSDLQLEQINEIMGAGDLMALYRDEYKKALKEL